MSRRQWHVESRMGRKSAPTVTSVFCHVTDSTARAAYIPQATKQNPESGT